MGGWQPTVIVAVGTYNAGICYSGTMWTTPKWSSWCQHQVDWYAEMLFKCSSSLRNFFWDGCVASKLYAILVVVRTGFPGNGFTSVLSAAAIEQSGVELWRGRYYHASTVQSVLFNERWPPEVITALSASVGQASQFQHLLYHTFYLECCRVRYGMVKGQGEAG